MRRIVPSPAHLSLVQDPMASLFGFFKRKPRSDAPVTPPADAPAAATTAEATFIIGPSGERIAVPITAEVTPAGATRSGTGDPAAACTRNGHRADERRAHPCYSARSGNDHCTACDRTEDRIPLRPRRRTRTRSVERAASDPASSGWFSRLKGGLSKTRQQLGERLVTVFGAGRKLDEAFYEELETVLLSSDVGISATEFLLENLRSRARREGYTEAEQLKEALGDLLLDLLSPLAKPLDVSTARPFVIMLAGVNGSGKTTSIGKLARYYQQQGKKVLLAAGDTFRAAAREQLIGLGRAQQRDRGRASSPATPPRSSSMPSTPRARGASTSCWPTPPAGCRRSFT